MTTGYKSGGHNSALIDNDGQRYLVYHTRFNNGTEFHEARVHQQFLNEDNWPVTAPYEFLGSKISSTGYSLSDMCGTYEFVNHESDASTANVGMLSTKSLTLNSNGKITGGATGIWSYTSGKYYCQMKIGNVTYKGVFFKQKDESSSHKERMTFSLIGSNNQTIWGSKTADIKVSTTITMNANNLTKGTYTSNISSGKFTIGASDTKNVIVRDVNTTVGSTTYSKLLNMNGAGNDSGRYIKFTTTGAGTVKITAASTSSTANRVIRVAKDSVGGSVQGDMTFTGTPSTQSVSVKSSGTYYIYSTNSGINVYNVSVTY